MKHGSWLLVAGVGVVLWTGVGGPAGAQRLGLAQVDAILREVASGVERGEGFWSARYAGSRIIVLAEESRERLRVVVPVAPVAELDRAALLELLEENFEESGDARWAVADRVVWAVYSHSLNGLSRDGLLRGLDQAVALGQSFGEAAGQGRASPS